MKQSVSLVDTSHCQEFLPNIKSVPTSLKFHPISSSLNLVRLVGINRNPPSYMTAL